MTRRRAGGAVAGLLAVVLLAGCSGGDEPSPAPTTAPSAAPSSARTPPPISPRTTVSSSPESTLSPPGGVPVPIPSDPQPDR
ncbi:hypothetical protein [Modestobacter italicus]|uniref:hypothetical protein n=1 Tax=Modestobacter italicus (strain DSM 44449 / CECT 9708 / BC 501) TaxID=2732864 RepID=UPI00030BA8EA|nr:hypothetical protein [Modestobacter marinus]